MPLKETCWKAQKNLRRTRTRFWGFACRSGRAERTDVAALHEVIEAELNKLQDKLEQAEIKKYKQAPAPPPRFVHPRPQEAFQETVRLPGMSGRYFGRTVMLDFAVWRDAA